EDVAAAQADMRLDVGRREYLAVEDARGDVGREAGDVRDGAVRDFVTSRLPAALRQAVRHVLREDADHVLAGRCDAAVVRGVEVQLHLARGRFARASPLGR